MPSSHPVRVLIDGPRWSGLDLTTLLTDAVTALGRPVVTIDAQDYLRPASLRFQRGRDDPDAFYESWIDVDALRREVVDAAGPDGSRRVLPTLWDADRDRATRAEYVAIPDSAIVVVSGWFLLGRWLDFDRTVHVALSPAARRRRVPPPDAARELPAWDRYDADVEPSHVADVVVLADDPRRPALIARR